MNLRIILHLLKSDWQRLKRPIVCLWLLLLTGASPWLLNRTDDFQVPLFTSRGWSGQLGDTVFHGHTRPMATFAALALGSILALVLASILGTQHAKRPLTPIRRRERILALALSIGLFLVLPHWLVTFTNLVLYDFAPDIAMLAAGAAGLTTWLLLGLAATLAVWLPSPWLLLAGWAAMFSSVGLIAEYSVRLDRLLPKFVALTMLPTGPREWLFAALATTLLAALSPICRKRLNAPARVGIVLFAVLAAGVPAVVMPPPDIRVAGDSQLHHEEIVPLLRFTKIDLENYPRTDGKEKFGLTAQLGATGLPPGCGVIWESRGGWISQNGRQVAEVHPPPRDPINPTTEAGFLTVDYRAAGVDGAVQAALPQMADVPDAPEIHLSNLGTCEPDATSRLDKDHPAELRVKFTGILFRFEKVWDIALTDAATRIADGDLIWHARRFDTENGKLCADVAVGHPALGISGRTEEVRWDASPIFQSRLYFQFPATGRSVRVDDSLLHATGPLFSGAGWHREILAPSQNQTLAKDLTGLRLILLRPVPLKRFTVITTSRFRPWITESTSDFAENNFPIGEKTFRAELFSKRPDPRTCSREEFARWLRIAASVYPGNSGSEHDLASFAPRFAGLMAKVANHESVAAGLRLGAPESMRDEIIGKIDSLEDPNRLAELALARGWLDEARESILRRFNEGYLWDSKALLALEKPTTYPELISRFLAKPEREDFERLRLLPGIQPLLTEALQRKAGGFLPPKLPTDRSIDAFGPHLYAAKLGNSEALATILDLFRSSDYRDKYFPFRDLGYVVKFPESLGTKDQFAWAQRQSATSLKYDPLSRIWKPLP